MTSPDDELDRLRAENARLVGLLETHGIAWQKPAPALTLSTSSLLNTDEKVALFRRLFRGRTDVYAIRWESKAGKSGYAPACANEWRPGICEKPRIKCGDCRQRQLLPLTDQVVFDHLAGHHVIGLYPLLSDDHCHLLAVDFDESDWREDARAFVQTCSELDIPVALEISRSGNGAHAWIFFSDRIAARDARRLGTALISHTCARTRQLKLSSYDRLFPNQDTLPKGGFGNLIALPLQKMARERGASVFVDAALRPYPDQWAFLATLRPLAQHDIEPSILRATGGSHPLDVTFATEEDLQEPWKHSTALEQRLSGLMPSSLQLTVANLIYIEKATLPPALANRLIRLAAFANPEFHQAQALRLPVWNKPRLIGCAENFPCHIALPRGCLNAIRQLLHKNDIDCEVRDQRCDGQSLAARFAGRLRDDQEQAVSAMLRSEIGILCAPTAFGKTVTAAALIARRGVNTLVLVHRTDLLRQWQERLQNFLEGDKDMIGVIGGGKSRPSGRIDIAVMQSLHRQGETNPIVENYGHVIVDECHHLSAVSFEAILKRVHARYVLGLTATPIRRDGRQPILFMQCGPIRHMAAKPAGGPQTLEVVPRYLPTRTSLSDDAPIQEIFRQLATDQIRTAAIADEIVHAFQRGGKVLVLTERTDHLDALHVALAGRVMTLSVLHGRQSKTQRASVISALNALDADAPRVLLASGRLVGEGFDHPPLDTLVLAMPISWKGILQQYAGRLHREQAGKQRVRIIDFIDSGHPPLLRMWERRQRGYQAMGYRTVAEEELDLASC